MDFCTLSKRFFGDVVRFAEDRDGENLCSVVRDQQNHEDHHTYPAIIQRILVQCIIEQRLGRNCDVWLYQICMKMMRFIDLPMFRTCQTRWIRRARSVRAL